jgi:hypothetical protein
VIHGGSHAAQREFRDGEWWATTTPARSTPTQFKSFHHLVRARTFVRSRLSLPRVRVAIGDVQRVTEADVRTSHVATRSAAPLVVPQRK